MSEKIQTRAAADVYADEVANISILDPERERELGKRILGNNDDAAREEIIRAHLGFAKSLARSTWLRYNNRNKISLDDLEQEANIGLIRAAQDFDYRVSSFATYARWWTKGMMQVALARAGLIRVPATAQRSYARVMNTMSRLTAELKRTPTVQELLVATKLPFLTVHRALGRRTFDVASLDAPIGDDGDATLQDFVPATNALTGEQVYEARKELQLAKARLSEIFDNVTKSCAPKQARAFYAVYGTGEAGTILTLEEAAKNLNISPQAVQQNLTGAWRNLNYKGRIGFGNDPLSKERERIAALQELLEAVDSSSAQ